MFIIELRSIGDPQGRWTGEKGSVPPSLGVGTWAMQMSCELKVAGVPPRDPEHSVPKAGMEKPTRSKCSAKLAE